MDLYDSDTPRTFQVEIVSNKPYEPRGPGSVLRSSEPETCTLRSPVPLTRVRLFYCGGWTWVLERDGSVVYYGDRDSIMFPKVYSELTLT